MTVWKNTLMIIERNERPLIDLLFFQKEMSFLKARTSKSVCSIETTAVTASSHGDVSANMRRISSTVASPCISVCCFRDCCICSVSIQRISVVTEKLSSSGSSASVSFTGM